MPFKAAYIFRPGFIQPLHGIKSKTKLYQAIYTVLGPAHSTSASRRTGRGDDDGTTWSSNDQRREARRIEARCLETGRHRSYTRFEYYPRIPCFAGPPSILAGEMIRGESPQHSVQLFNPSHFRTSLSAYRP